MAGEGADCGFRHAGAGICPDEALAAAEVQPGRGALVRHGLGETKHVGEGVLFRCVGPDPNASQRGTKGGVVDADESSEAGMLVDRY